MLRTLLIAVVVMLATSVHAQKFADSAQAGITFPHFVNGGNPNDYWVTSITVTNPSPHSASMIFQFMKSDGSPQQIEINGVTNTQFYLDVPAWGVRDLVATRITGDVVSGYVQAAATYPVQAVCVFKRIQGGKPIAIVTSEPTLSTYSYTQLANRDLGIALVNSTASASTYFVEVSDTNGKIAGQTQISLEPLAHTAFNLGVLFPALPADYRGIIEVRGTQPQHRFYAWALYDDGSRVNSSLPTGRRTQPASIDEVVYRVYWSLVREAEEFLGPEPVNFSIIRNTSEINAYASLNGRDMFITLPLVELLIDSPDELAHVLAHELGHLIQVRRGSNMLDPNKEFDADIIGGFIAVGAGYNPYALAGWLARAAMVTGTADLRTQTFFDNMTIVDAHSSINNRISSAFENLKKVCTLPGMAPVCGDIKRLNRPHLPPAAPLGRGGRSYQQ